MYGYANGDPVKFADPFGLCMKDPKVKKGETSGCEQLVAYVSAIAAPARTDADFVAEPGRTLAGFESFDAALLESILREGSMVAGKDCSPNGSKNSNRFIYNVIRGVGGRGSITPAKRFKKGAPGICGGTGIGEGSTGTDCDP